APVAAHRDARADAGRRPAAAEPGRDRAARHSRPLRAPSRAQERHDAHHGERFRRWDAAAVTSFAPGWRPVALAVVLSLLGARAGRALDVEITTVRATASGPSDARLIELRPRLRRLVGYRSFQVMGTERRTCTWRTGEAFTIPGGRLLHVVPKAMRDQAVGMEVRLVDGPRNLVDTDVRLQNRGVMLFGVDEDGQVSGEALIIMLKAEE